MTLTDSSPFFVFMTVPSAPTQSPRSRSSKAAWLSSPITARDTNSWTEPVPSRTVANVSLPWRRMSSSRPATLTVSSTSAPGSIPPYAVCSSAAVWVRSKLTG